MPFHDDTNDSPTTPGSWRATLNSLGIRPSKGMGQNFLVDRGIVERMVRVTGIDRDDTVLEIGPGLGILTGVLARSAGNVIAIELDKRLAAYLASEFQDTNVHIVHGDALTVRYEDFLPAAEPYTVVANLPYSVGTAITRRLLESEQKPERLALMVQREVAERMVAAPPDMSLLSISVQVYAAASIAFIVPPTVFVPRPKVESAVVILEPYSVPVIAPRDRERFFQIVSAGFQQRRKQLANSLAKALELPKAEVLAWLIDAGVDPTRRPETLAVDDWVELYRRRPASLQ